MMKQKYERVKTKTKTKALEIDFLKKLTYI